jgi:UDP-2,3-diacylglucosamine pyrophosphatase LpxH
LRRGEQQGSMLDPAKVEALVKLINTFVEVIRVLGLLPTIGILVLLVGAIVGYRWWQNKQADAAWERTLKVKDDMIEQLNDQNREFRVQVLVMGGLFSKTEASAMVYGDDRLVALAKQKDPSS